MGDLRALFSSPEEAFRTMWAGVRSHMHTAMVSRVTKASDGHVVEVQPTVQQAIKDETLTQTDYVDYPLVVDSPVHFPGGARMVLSHGLAVGDEVVSLFAENGIDFWHANGDTQQPISDRTHSLSDGITFPSVRSDPRRLQQVDAAAMHLRSEDKLHVHETHPDRGHRTFSADPSTPAASATFDPLSQAEKYIDHAVTGVGGLIGRAVDGGTEHSHGVDHDQGAWMSALNGEHLVRAHPTIGALLSAFGGAHTVNAGASGVQISSSAGVSISCPPGTLSLPKGTVSGGSITTGGDLSGTLDKPKVVNLSNVVGQDQELVRAKSDAAAGAAGVEIGELYVNVAVASGVGLLAVRLA